MLRVGRATRAALHALAGATVSTTAVCPPRARAGHATAAPPRLPRCALGGATHLRETRVVRDARSPLDGFGAAARARAPARASLVAAARLRGSRRRPSQHAAHRAVRVEHLASHGQRAAGREALVVRNAGFNAVLRAQHCGVVCTAQRGADAPVRRAVQLPVHNLRREHEAPVPARVHLRSRVRPQVVVQRRREAPPRARRLRGYGASGVARACGCDARLGGAAHASATGPVGGDVAPLATRRSTPRPVRSVGTSSAARTRPSPPPHHRPSWQRTGCSLAFPPPAAFCARR